MAQLTPFPARIPALNGQYLADTLIRWFNAIEIKTNTIPDVLNLTIAEIHQLQNIDVNTISNAQWGYLGVMDQNVRTSDSPTFGGATINGNITITGTVDGVDVAALKTDVDGFPDSLKTVSASKFVTTKADGTFTGVNIVCNANQVVCNDNEVVWV